MQISRTYKLDLSLRAVMLAFLLMLIIFMTDDKQLQVSLVVVLTVYLCLTSLLSHVKTVFKLTRDRLYIGKNLRKVITFENIKLLIVMPRRVNYNFFYNIRDGASKIIIHHRGGVVPILIDNAELFIEDFIIKTKHINDNVKIKRLSAGLGILGRVLSFCAVVMMFAVVPIVMVPFGTARNRYDVFVDKFKNKINEVRVTAINFIDEVAAK